MQEQHEENREGKEEGKDERDEEMEARDQEDYEDGDGVEEKEDGYVIKKASKSSKTFGNLESTQMHAKIDCAVKERYRES